MRNLSVKQRNRIVDELDSACTEVVQNTILDSLVRSFESIIGPQSGNQWDLRIDEAGPDQQTILFIFPRKSGSVAELDYVKPVVRIELGARPENQPTERHSIQPYAAEEFPDSFKNPKSEITVLAVQRTFWEKATILHDQYHRAADYKTADRISRHYYDFYMLAEAGVAKKALENLELLESVVINKKSFFYRAGAKYEEALPGQLHLVPNSMRLEALKRDYGKMNSMFFKEPPNFEDMIELLSKLEKEINSIVS